jgi:hypothetical protein
LNVWVPVPLECATVIVPEHQGVHGGTGVINAARGGHLRRDGAVVVDVAEVYGRGSANAG